MTTLTMNDDALLDFVRRELRSIRPALPASWPAAALYKADLALDSLDLVELVARLEQRYGLLVPDADLPQFVSLEATVRYVAERAPA